MFSTCKQSQGIPSQDSMHNVHLCSMLDCSRRTRLGLQFSQCIMSLKTSISSLLFWCLNTLEIGVYPGQFAMWSTMQVPYGTSFHQNVQWACRYEGRGKCRLRVTGEVEFTKSPFVKGMIQKASEEVSPPTAAALISVAACLPRL